jgi:type IV secretion system protein VirD4
MPAFTPTREQVAAQDKQLLAMTITVAVLAAVALALAWAAPLAIAWVNTGRIAHLTVVEAFKAIGTGKLLSGDPAAAYPPAVRVLLPAGWGYWSTLGLLVALPAAVVVAGAREAWVRMSRPAADRRWWQLKGRRPHEFGRYGTVRALAVDRAEAGRHVVGRFARPSTLLATQPRVQIAIVAAPQSGKTTGEVEPILLEHVGPATSTSTKTDVVRATSGRRRRLGEVLVWDPFGERSDGWDPLQGCEDWGHALLMARWLGHAKQLGQASTQDYFDAESEGLTAPLLHAAAHTPDLTILDVYQWILTRNQEEPTGILREIGAGDALQRLENVYAYTERQRDGIIGTAKVHLDAYGHPAAARTARRHGAITPARVLDAAAANTLYIVAGREHQDLLAPLVVTLISSLLFYAGQRENQTGRGLWPPALFALDETANIAPLQDLPQILSTSLSAGVQFLTVWQNVSQIRQRYGPEAAAEILALSQAKIFLGSITDQHTRGELVELLGQRQSAAGEEQRGRTSDVLSAQALQRLSGGEGLLVHGNLPPVFFRQRRSYADRHLRQLMGDREPSLRPIEASA